MFDMSWYRTRLKPDLVNVTKDGSRKLVKATLTSIRILENNFILCNCVSVWVSTKADVTVSHELRENSWRKFIRSKAIQKQERRLTITDPNHKTFFTMNLAIILVVWGPYWSETGSRSFVVPIACLVWPRDAGNEKCDYFHETVLNWDGPQYSITQLSSTTNIVENKAGRLGARWNGNLVCINSRTMIRVKFRVAICVFVYNPKCATDNWSTN